MTMTSGAFAASLGFGACFGGEFVRGLACVGDADCGRGYACVDGVCGGPGDWQLCGNGLLDAGERCDDGNAVNGDGCSVNCDLCGNGTVEPDEACDDGNTERGDACTPECRFPTCGDGVVDPGEECDDGDADGADDCTPACTVPACGDGFVNVAGEACDDGNASETDDCTTACTLAPEVPTLVLSPAPIKQFGFTWQSRGAASVQLHERVDPQQAFAPIVDSLTGGSYARTVPLHLRSRASYMLRACNDAGRCVDSPAVDVVSQPIDAVGNLAAAIGYFKASNTDVQDAFGTSVAISADGGIMAIGAPAEDSGVPGDPSDGSAPNSGAVYVFVREGADWQPQAYLKADVPIGQARFGQRVALSADGGTMAVGADILEDGAIRVFVRDGSTWTPHPPVQPSEPQEFFGKVLALSGDGRTLVAGAPFDDIDPEDLSENSGAVHVFVRDGASWPERAFLKALHPGDEDGFGASVALSDDGRTIAVGAHLEDSGSDEQEDESVAAAGAVYMFVREPDVEEWTQRAYLKAERPGSGDNFGYSVALAGDGATLAVGAHKESSGATDVGGDQSDDSAPEAGAVYVFERDGAVWSQQAYIKASNTGEKDWFGYSVALAGDGRTMAVDAYLEDSVASGIGGGQDNDPGDMRDMGAVYVFTRDDVAGWSQASFIKPPNPIERGPAALALTADGGTLVLGAPHEASAATDIGGDQIDDGSLGAGAVYLY